MVSGEPHRRLGSGARGGTCTCPPTDRACDNATSQDDADERRALLTELFAEVGDRAWIEPPFQCDYGWNITLEDRAFLNFNCVDPRLRSGHDRRAHADRPRRAALRRDASRRPGTACGWHRVREADLDRPQRVDRRGRDRRPWCDDRRGLRDRGGERRAERRSRAFGRGRRALSRRAG